VKKFAPLLLATSVLSASLLPAGAQGLDQVTRSGINAHAVNFSGRSCRGGIDAKPSDATTPSRFKLAVLLLDEMMKEAASKDRTVKYRSEFNEKDLYRATVSGTRGQSFLMMFFQGGKAFVYKCDLK